MSLRLRLTLATAGFVLIGLLVAGVVTYGSLQSFLLRRVDQQLQTAKQPVLFALFSGQVPPQVQGSAGNDNPYFPSGTVGELIAPDGTMIVGHTFSYGGPTTPMPQLPATIGSATRVQVFSAGAVGSSSFRFRVLSQPLEAGQGTLVVAIPLTEVGDTLRRLLLIEVLVAAGVLIGLGSLSWWIVRRELRPLLRIEETAGAIAAGDLTRRVENDDARTEVGRLGRALNAMLSQIERAFAERHASESRLRRFLADASHELRTPLTSIRGYSELFRRTGGDASPDTAAGMRRIEQEATRMGRIVEDLLLLARLDRGRPLERAPVDLVMIAQDAASDARAIDPSRSIRLRSPEALLLEGDDAKLRQVAGNLLSNAVNHTPPGSPIEVDVSARSGLAFLEVTDHGPGLPEDERVNVFEPFYRSDPARSREAGGAGLGLSIVRAIAVAHGGNVEALPVEGGGTRFRMTVPLGSVEPGGEGAASSQRTPSSVQADTQTEEVS